VAKVPESNCGIGIVKAVVDSFPEDQIKLADSLLRKVFSLSSKNTEEAVTTARVVASAFVDTVTKTTREPVEKGMTEIWQSKFDMPTATKPGTKGKPREARNMGLMHQHRLLNGQISILGQTRSYYYKTIKNGPFTPGIASNLVTRLNTFDGIFRISGIPLVTMKVGGEHVSHLTTGDIFKVLIGRDVKAVDTVIEGFLRGSSAQENIPFQNLTEATRRIIEHNDMRKPLSGIELDELKADVMDALVNAMGRPVDSGAAAAMDATRKWMMSDEGRVIVGKVADALTEPRAIDALIAEDLVQRQVALVFQRADGIRMTQQVLDSIANSPWTGDNLEGLGMLLFQDGLREILGKDFMVKLSPDGVNLAFGEQFFAKVMAALTPENLAHMREVSSNIYAAKKAKRLSLASGKTTKTPINKTRKEINDEVSEAAAKKAENDVQNDPNARVSEPSVEASQMAETFYNELKYGGAVGKLAKALSVVSDRATMTSKGKTILVGTEHVRLESAGTMVAGLRKLNDSINGDTARANRVFADLARNVGNSMESVEEALKALPEADRVFGADLLKYVDAMFGAGDNNALMMNNIFVDDMVKSLRAVGLREQGDALAGSGIVHAEDLLGYWRTFEPGDQNILDFMGKYYSAQQIAMIPPTMADSLARHFSHSAEGLSTAAAKAEGWFKLDSNSTLGKYMDYNPKEEVLFPPEFKGRIKAIEDYLDYDRQKNITEAIRKIDQITSIMKSSITLWRPGHHMVSALGNMTMNVLAGAVNPYDYSIGVKMLIKRGDVSDIDDNALNELMRLQAPLGTKLKDDSLGFVKDSAGRDISIEDLILGAERTGAFINPRRVRDIVTTDDLGSGAFSANRLLTKNPVARGIEAVDHEIARFAAVRDNFARMALFVKEVRKMPAKATLEDTFLSAAAKVHEFHPTVGTLTAPERRVARRLFYFYTWQKQAFFKILEVTANTPAVVTVPSKLQFAIATSQGLDPYSFGDPYAANGWFAGYNSASLYGPQWTDEKYGAMGVKPPIAQLDVIDGYLSGIRFQPGNGLWENVGSLASNAFQEILVTQAAPIFRMPAELALNTRTTTGQEIFAGGNFSSSKLGEYLIDNTGAGSLSRIYDWTPWGPRSDTQLDPYSDFNRDRQWYNYLFGLKYTAYEAPAAMQRARQESVDYYKKLYKTGQYAPKMSLAEFNKLKEGE
jgi:hypothetical protein